MPSAACGGPPGTLTGQKLYFLDFPNSASIPGADGASKGASTKSKCQSAGSFWRKAAGHFWSVSPAAD